MRPGRLPLFAAIVLGVALTPASGWDIGFNFRNTSGWVTDPSPTTWVIAGSTGYPTTRTVSGQVVTFGWETVPSGAAAHNRDRSNSAGPLLAGLNCTANNGTSMVFRVDLPSTGIYRIGLALGDGMAGTPWINHVKINSTSATVLSVDAASSNTFADATGVARSPSTWVSSNVMVQRTFGTTILRMVLGATVDTGYVCVAHLRVTLVPVAAVFPGQRHFVFQ